MPRITVDENDAEALGGDLFPKLDLGDAGEVARLFCPTDNAWAEWTHNIRAPQFEAGVPLVTSSARNGQERYDTVSVSWPPRICMGDAEIMQEKRSDPDNCPACREALKDEIEGLQADRRYALPVIRYACKNTKSDVVRTGKTAGGDIVVFCLTSRMYKDLIKCIGQMRDLLEIPAPQEIHLRSADVIVEREPGGPMRLKWLAPKRSAARADEGVRDFIRALWGDPENRPSDAQLRARCGREPDLGFLMKDLRWAASQWAKVRRYEKSGTADADPLDGEAARDRTALSAREVDDILGEDETDNASQAKPAAAADPLAGDGEHPGGVGEFRPKGASGNGHAKAAAAADPLAGDADDIAAAEAVAAAKPAAASAADPLADEPAARQPAGSGAKAASGKAVNSFDDILGDED